MTSPWLTLDQAAEYCHWSRDKMQELLAEIPYVKAGRHVRVHVRELDAYLESKIVVRDKEQGEGKDTGEPKPVTENTTLRRKSAVSYEA